jgi:class 3 adenylate cyclase
MLEVHEADIDRITAAIHQMLKGRVPCAVELPPDYPENEVRQLAEYVNTFSAQYGEFSGVLFALSRGELEFELPKGGLQVLQSFKNLHANLRHLTWKTQQIAKGDFSQRIDFMGGFSEAFNSMTQQLKEAFETIERQNRDLAEANRVIQEEKEKSDRLLLNILPARVAEELKQRGRTEPELFEHVTVYFSDLVGFTSASARLSPGKLIAELNDIFTQFDHIVEAHRCERIKTIGDAYLAVCGMPEPDPEHARRIVRAAVDMVSWLNERNLQSELQWQARVGIHSGPLVGSVVGVKKYIYDVFGDTVNTASRMESNSEPMRINISEATHDLVKNDFSFMERSPLEVKGKGPMRMYFVQTDAPRGAANASS